MVNKKASRLRRAKRARSRIRGLGVNRLCVFRTPRHMYAQIIGPDGGTTVVTASTVEKAVKGDVKYTGNADAAAQVGKLIAERAQEKGIESVAFDRSGFKFHGRVKALADAAREAGLKF